MMHKFSSYIELKSSAQAMLKSETVIFQSWLIMEWRVFAKQ